MSVLAILTLASGVAFVGYGVSCLSSRSMKEEFERWGLAGFRRLVGTLEVLGGIGLLAGPKWPLILTGSSAGLCLLMILGLGVRLKSRDGALLSLPAALLLLTNGYILVHSL